MPAPPPGQDQALVDDPAAPPEPVEGPPPDGRRRRRRLWIAAAATVASVVAIVVAVVVGGGGGTPVATGPSAQPSPSVPPRVPFAFALARTTWTSYSGKASPANARRAAEQIRVALSHWY